MTFPVLWGAAMLTTVPAGASPVGGECPNATVVILGNVKGDRRVGSPRVNVSAAGATRSDPSRRLEPISKLLKHDANGPELYEPEEVDWVVFPTHE